MKKLEVNVNKTKIVIFRKIGRKRKARNETFMFDKEKITVVKSYTYLGVLFSESSTFYRACQESIGKANLAVNSSLSIINKVNENQWVTNERICDSLVISVLFYSIQVWGLRYLDKIERMQINFFKRLLRVPINTPAYAVRLETGRKRLEVRVFKLILTMMERILQMSDERYPKICFNRLRDTKFLPDLNEKYNWGKQVFKFFESIGEVNAWKTISFEYILKNKLKLIKAFETYVHEEDKKRLYNSQSLQILPCLTLKEKTQHNLLIKNHLEYTRLFAQIRMENFCNIRLVFQNKVVKLNSNNKCWDCE